MKITTFDPIIISKDAAAAVKLFEELGFERTHNPTTDVGETEISSTRMKDSNGFHVDIADAAQLPQDILFLRMNVDNFDEAYDILVKHGFKNTKGDRVIETKSAKAVTMAAPSGFVISLVQHIKK